MPNLWEVTPMSEALHCDCDVDENRREFYFHLPNCLVGAVLAMASALIIQDNDATDGMGAVEVLGVVVRDGLGDIARAVSGEY